MEKLENIEHHNLFFDTDFEKHAEEIYDNPIWPSEPLFYANFPSKTDETMAPDGYEAGFFLIPIAPGLEDTKALRDQYFDIIMDRFEERTQQEVKNNILFRESFCVNDFVEQYIDLKRAYRNLKQIKHASGLKSTVKKEGFEFTGLHHRAISDAENLAKVFIKYLEDWDLYYPQIR